MFSRRFIPLALASSLFVLPTVVLADCTFWNRSDAPVVVKLMLNSGKYKTFTIRPHKGYRFLRSGCANYRNFTFHVESKYGKGHLVHYDAGTAKGNHFFLDPRRGSYDKIRIVPVKTSQRIYFNQVQEVGSADHHRRWEY